MIAISTMTQNISGSLVLYEDESSDFEDYSTRVSRTKTLDGGVHINHSGFSHGDRTFIVIAKITEAEGVIAKNIQQTETLIWISCKEGFFSGVIESIKIDGMDLTMSIMIKEKLSS